jgi:hypothetical protein
MSEISLMPAGVACDRKWATTPHPDVRNTPSEVARKAAEVILIVMKCVFLIYIQKYADDAETR